MSKKIKNKKLDLSLLVLVIVLGIVAVGESDSAFSDSKKIESNRITTGEWTEENGSVKADHGDVIINEIHWAGSPASANDQWIELFNTTDEDISLKNWVIENAGQPKKGLKITANATIKAGEYILITRRNPNSARSALEVSNYIQNGSLYLSRIEYKQMILKDAQGNEIDRTPENSPWPEGVCEEEERYFSMQRQNQTEKAGTSTNSWKTCDPDGHDPSTYWKEEHRSVMCGTPRHPNQPDEAPSLEIHSVEENENNEKEDDDNSGKKKQDESKGNNENKEDEEEADDKELDKSEEGKTVKGKNNNNYSEEETDNDESEGDEDEDEDLSNNGDGDEVNEDDEEDDDEDNAGDEEGESNDPDESKGESGDTENENNNKDDNSPEDETDNDESDDDEDEDGDEVENEDDTENENN